MSCWHLLSSIHIFVFWKRTFSQVGRSWWCRDIPEKLPVPFIRAVAVEESPLRWVRAAQYHNLRYYRTIFFSFFLKKKSIYLANSFVNYYITKLIAIFPLKHGAYTFKQFYNTFYFTVRRLCLSLSLLCLPTPSCRLPPLLHDSVWQEAAAAASQLLDGSLLGELLN